MSSAWLLPIVLLVGLLASEGDAIFCYQCNSGEIYDKRACTDLTQNSRESKLSKNCSDLGSRDGFPYERCRTMVQDVEGDIRVVRSCATWPDKEKHNRCIDRTGTAKIKVRYCECEGDHCNKGSTIHLSLSLLMIYIGLQFIKSISL